MRFKLPIFLTPQFRLRLEKVQDSLSEELGHQITFRVIEEDLIAELYLASLGRDRRIITEKTS